jgi:tRNA(fMet)-specific endonuclease VapC
VSYLLDTDISSYLIKGKSPLLEAKLAGLHHSQVAISAITRAELLYGLKRLPAAHQLHLAVNQFLKIIRVLAWDAGAATWYAEIKHQLHTDGQPIGDMDMLIAAHALSAGTILVTNNTRHFERIEAPLVLENWQ